MAKSTKPVRLELIPYLPAIQLLRDRLNATPEEVAAWVFLGPNEGGLTAYSAAAGDWGVKRFQFGSFPFDHYTEPDGCDYCATLVRAQFARDEVANFQPQERFMTGATLRERWSQHFGIQVDSFIRSMVEDDQLLGLHPMLGVIAWEPQGTSSQNQTALFKASEVRAIEVANGIADSDAESSLPLDPVNSPPPGSAKNVTFHRIPIAFRVMPKPANNEAYWKRKLSDPPDWLKNARAFRGGPAVPSLWNPRLVALALLHRGVMDVRQLDRAMREHFQEHLVQWLEDTGDVDRRQ